MTTYSTLDRSVPAAGVLPGGEALAGLNPEQDLEQKVEQGNATRTSQASISAALAAANASHSTLAASVRFPGEDGGCSLAELAQRDLDVALQLLADRAQFITGANGAAIALRRTGKNDMLCRASTGSNVPELGALFSTEFGLSGESVRTRRPLRCDDAERDPRVNREGCRELGIASVVVMPVVNDDEVLGVFELFSGKVNAFGERDLSALQRLSEMVETAVKLARAAETLPGQVMGAGSAVGVASEGGDDDILGEEVFAGEVLEAPVAGSTSGAAAPDQENRTAVLEALRHPKAEPLAVAEFLGGTSSLTAESLAAGSSASEGVAEASRIEVQAASAADPRSVQAPAPKKPLFWSAALNPVADGGTAAEVDQSHVPPVLRNLRTCEACGFPVSPGRALCVECEEKRWRGQLKRPAASLPESASSKSPLLAKDARNGAPGLRNEASPLASGPVARLVAAAAAAPGPARQSAGVVEAVSIAAAPVKSADVLESVRGNVVAGRLPAAVAADSSVTEAASAPAKQNPDASPAASQEFVLSAGLEPSQSWLARNRYIVVALLVVAATVAAIFVLR